MHNKENLSDFGISDVKSTHNVYLTWEYIGRTKPSYKKEWNLAKKCIGILEFTLFQTRVFQLLLSHH